MLDYPLFLGHFGTLGWGQEPLRRGQVPKNHRPRLSSRHAPMKENIPTTPPTPIPTKNGGECAASPAFTKKWCSRCPKARVVSSTASPLKMLTIRMAVNSATQSGAVQGLTRSLFFSDLAARRGLGRSRLIRGVGSL